MIDVRTATTAELVEFYNEHADAPVKRFSDRRTAERRVSALIDELSDNAEDVIDELDLEDEEEITVARPAVVSPKRSASRSEAIRKSWEDNQTKAKRSQRSAVVVNGEEFPSVRKAFLALELPLNEHIKFRMQLKRDGQAKAYGYHWKVIPLNYEQEEV